MQREYYALRIAPRKPFEDYKWKWATTTCTESLNDPVVLLGVLSRMKHLEGSGLKYSSDAFNEELIKLENDLDDSIGVSLSSRGGSRNLIRNSGQYWKALGLIPRNSHGVIELTDFGRKVASGAISQSEFAALIVRTFKLPNPYTSSIAEIQAWDSAGLQIYPLMLLLQISQALYLEGSGWLTANEVAHVVIPLAGESTRDISAYVESILEYRENPIKFSDWPDCVPMANDLRMVREYLLFLDHYGFLSKLENGEPSRFDTKFEYNSSLDEEITDLLSDSFLERTGNDMLDIMRVERIASGMDSKRLTQRSSRPEQAAFRREVLDSCKRCIITNAQMPEILQAAHIKPHKYNGPESADNGLAMRMDIHRLFDTNHLRIRPDGVVFLSERARYDYGMTIPPTIIIPETINIEYLRWRWDNYVGLC